MGPLVEGAIALGVILFLAFGFQWKPKPSIGNLKNKHVLITGGSSGIGLQIAKEALLEGAFVTIVARTPAKLEMAVEDLRREVKCDASRINSQAADVSKYENISKAIKESHLRRPIDVLICNAGFLRSMYLENTSIEEVDLTIQTNLTGTLYTLHAALPLMKKREGRPPASVVLMCSLSSLFMLYGHDVYTATKYALRGLAESLRLQLIPYNIRVSLVCPGFVETPLLDQCEAEIEDGMLALVKLFNLYNRKKAEDPKDVAKYTLKAAKEGRFITTAFFPGLFLATLSRGVLPADSAFRALLELILYLPLRLVSFIIASVTPCALKYVYGHGNMRARITGLDCLWIEAGDAARALISPEHKTTIVCILASTMGPLVEGAIALGVILCLAFGFQWKPKPSIGSLKKKHVLITGGSSGIGLQIAKEALLEGAFVTIVARTPAKLEMAVEDLRREVKCDASRINSQAADVSKYENISKAIKESHLRRPIDVLICHAGFDTSIEEVDLTIQTNLTGTLYTLRAALPLMKKREGRLPAAVVLMSSLSSLFLIYGHDVYTATKYALRGLAESLRLQLIPYNIRVSLVCPGFVETPLLDQCEAEIEDGMLALVKLFNLYNREKAEGPKDVAKYTLEAGKEGRFITTEFFPGIFLATLSRGVLPADSVFRALLELILYLPFRLVSFIIASVIPCALKYVHGKYYKLSS
ncbi:hypothetical protein KI387_025742 [Taxus chinensis]|uniref:Ketoreductase domain-containing protein n=1 Tax=Taxus chinensis TaxID=29808 RepID=A0AA38FUJ4_TAXCH|nr:hypothetical protein KI387_025742 [Taxus chinensis]